MAFANIQNIETIDGGAGYDTLQAGSGDDVLGTRVFGRGRRWSISMAATGIDKPDGGAGNDRIIGTAGMTAKSTAISRSVTIGRPISDSGGGDDTIYAALATTGLTAARATIPSTVMPATIT